MASAMLRRPGRGPTYPNATPPIPGASSSAPLENGGKGWIPCWGFTRGLWHRDRRGTLHLTRARARLDRKAVELRGRGPCMFASYAVALVVGLVGQPPDVPPFIKEHAKTVSFYYKAPDPK